MDKTIVNTHRIPCHSSLGKRELRGDQYQDDHDALKLYKKKSSDFAKCLFAADIFAYSLFAAEVIVQEKVSRIWRARKKSPKKLIKIVNKICKPRKLLVTQLDCSDLQTKSLVVNEETASFHIEDLLASVSDTINSDHTCTSNYSKLSIMISSSCD